MIEFLLANKADIEARDNDGKTALLVAVLSGSKVAVETFLEHGARVDVADKLGATALHLAVIDRLNSELLEPLIQAGANLNARNIEGGTPLHFATYCLVLGIDYTWCAKE